MCRTADAILRVSHGRRRRARRPATYADEDRKDLYIPYVQDSPGRYGSFYTRTDEPLEELTRRLRAAVGSIDPKVIINEPVFVSGEDRQLSRARFMTSVLTGFATLAAFLAALGTYAVIAYVVQQRERELAIRLASGSAVTALFLKDGARLIAFGIAFGLVGAAIGWPAAPPR